MVTPASQRSASPSVICLADALPQPPAQEIDWTGWTLELWTEFQCRLAACQLLSPAQRIQVEAEETPLHLAESVAPAAVAAQRTLNFPPGRLLPIIKRPWEPGVLSTDLEALQQFVETQDSLMFHENTIVALGLLKPCSVRRSPASMPIPTDHSRPQAFSVSPQIAVMSTSQE